MAEIAGCVIRGVGVGVTHSVLQFSRISSVVGSLHVLTGNILALGEMGVVPKGHWYVPRHASGSPVH